MIYFFFLIFSHFVQADVFRLGLYSDPQTLSPLLQKSTSGLYLVNQLTAPFLKYQDGVLSPYRAQCRWKKKHLILECQMLKKYFWSDGTPLKLSDYLKTIQLFLDPKIKSPKADLFFPIKNAFEIYQNKKSEDQLGIKIIDDRMIIELAEDQADFIYALSLAQWTPTHPKDLKLLYKDYSASDFAIKSWNRNKNIMLKRNPFSEIKDHLEIEFKIVTDDSLAIQMYESKELEFVRRVPTAFIPVLEKRKDFFKIDQIKFDFIAVSPVIKNSAVKKAFGESLNFTEMQKIYSAKSRPGCSGLPNDWSTKEVCLSFQPSKEIPADLKSDLLAEKWKYSFSLLGGWDHQVTAEWLQLQWKKNLNIEVEIAPLEDRIFIQRIKSDPPPLFRRGFSPDLPSCYQVLKEFLPDGRESYLKIKSEELSKWVSEIKKSENRELCTKGQEFLIQEVGLIPTGKVYFSILASPQWTGWKLNDLNQLDLTNLKKNH